MIRTDSGLVQPILVAPGGSHLDVVAAVMWAATSALVADRSNPVWDEWLSEAFTKTVRTVNATQFDRAVTELLPTIGGATADSADAAAVAFTPMRYEDFPKLVSRGRVAGLDRPRVDQPAWAHRRCVLLNAELAMSTGKSAAQAAHALMAGYLRAGADVSPASGFDADRRCGVIEVDGLEFDAACTRNPEAVITDSGFTEIAPGTRTAVLITTP